MKIWRNTTDTRSQKASLTASSGVLHPIKRRRQGNPIIPWRAGKCLKAVTNHQCGAGYSYGWTHFRKLSCSPLPPYKHSGNMILPGVRGRERHPPHLLQDK
jgi:hypothetical protein